MKIETLAVHAGYTVDPATGAVAAHLYITHGADTTYSVTVTADDGTNTATNLHRYYSYRAELGKTGRMLALLALKP